MLEQGCTHSCECFFFNDTATTEIYTLSLHDALPIFVLLALVGFLLPAQLELSKSVTVNAPPEYSFEEVNSLENWKKWSYWNRSEEHTSELQSRQYLVCRLLLEKKKFLLVLHL